MIALAMLLATALPFAEGHPVPHVTAIPPYGFVDTVIRLHFNVAKSIVYGDETTTVRTREALGRLPFDSLGIHYQAVSLDGHPAQYVVDDAAQSISVSLPHRVAAGTQLVVRFRYWAQPARGMYFIRPDPAYPKLNPEIWTQGEATDNRRWFPTWDEPNDKTPSELIVTVPHGWSVIANGRLMRHSVGPAEETWDWVSPHPKSTYLIAFAAGRFAEYRARLGALPIDSFVAPSDAAMNSICFRDTPKMIAYYQRIIGFPYPFAKYDQIAVERFTFGGMENASATIVADSFLHPEVEDPERSCDNVVSHELAQQWFGDDVTMSDWSNEWINEGFATYFDELWSGHQNGAAAFEYARYQGEQAFFDEARRYLRPIVDYRYNDPLDLFDVTGHARAAAVLQMLRYLVGDKRFFSALHAYLGEYQYRNADTDAFFTSVERSLHMNLKWFEDEWFYRAAYPHYIVDDRYDPDQKALVLDVRQRNADGKPFRMPVVIEAYAGGRVSRVRVWIDRNQQTIRIADVARPPNMVLFDPNENLLRKLTFEQPVSMLAYQLKHAPHVGDREWALGQLAAMVHATSSDRMAAARAIESAALDDPFYGMRAGVVKDAAAFGGVRTVLACLHDRDVRVRIAAAEAAAALPRHQDGVDTALARLTRDRDPDVIAAALRSLGARRALGAYRMLTAAVARAPYDGVVASAALGGLGELGDARAFPLLLQKTTYGTPERERNAAVVALALLAKRLHQPDRALAVLEHLVLKDDLISTRLAAASALGTLGDPRAIPALRRVERSDTQEIVRIQAWTAIQKCR